MATGHSSSVGSGTGILLESGTNEVEFLEFTVSGQHFAVNVAKVKQTLVLKDLKLTRPPGSNLVTPGFIHYREAPTRVVDLRACLELGAPPEDTSKLLLLVMEFNQRTTGYIIDTVEGIQRHSWEQFEPLEMAVWKDNESCAVGTVTINNRVIVILDLEAMMAKLDPSMRIENHAAGIPESASIDRSSLKIVYAEDSALIQKVTLRTLTAAGFTQIETFTTGAKALEYVRTAPPGEVDFIISDIEMPEMDGLTFCKNAKGLPGFDKVPFIFFSSLISTEMERKCQSVGGDGSFSKPQIDKLVQEMEKVWERYQSRR